MKLFSALILGYFLVCRSVLKCVHGKQFHVPYACSVLYDLGNSKDAVLIGACSILDSKVVIVSVDNFNEPIASNSEDFFYNKIEDIVVHAGSDYMDPTKVRPRPPGAQSRRAKTLYVPRKPSFDFTYRDFLKNPNNISRESGQIEYDVFGAAFNVGFLLLDKDFVWSPYVFPIILTSCTVDELKKNTLREIKFQEQQAMPIETCFTYSYNAGLNKIRYHEVTYLFKKNCMDAYCWQRLSKCSLFPRLDHLLCYKSVKYIDVCPEARGAALYCEHFNRSVIGILTSAPMCGRLNTPGVYTTLPLVADFYRSVFEELLLPVKAAHFNLEDLSLEQ